MKLLRYGPPGKEKPGLVDLDPAVRDAGSESCERCSAILRPFIDDFNDQADALRFAETEILGRFEYALGIHSFHETRHHCTV